MNNDSQCSKNDPLAVTFEGGQISFEQLESLYQLQRNILEDVALKQSYKSVLIKLCLMAEKMVPNSLGSIMLLDDLGLLNVLVAPSMPQEGIDALQGLKPGPHGGSCGNTVYCQQPTFVNNVSTDERWLDLRSLAETYGLGACWSMPIKTVEDHIIGTFALTSFEPREPSAFQRRLLDTCAYIASIVIRRHQSEQKLEFLAYHDALTSLPNRTYLKTTIEDYILSNTPFSVVMFGLDRFKSINDTHGHDVGDQVLIVCANLLNKALAERSQVFRISSDEFVFLTIDADPCDSVTSICKHLKSVFVEPVQINECQFYLSGSMGAACFTPEKPTSFYTLIKQADLAMFDAKQKGGVAISIFEPEMAVRVEDNLALESDIHHALDHQEFEVYYQPILNTQSGSFSNLEALIRWNHPVKGVISPLAFISLMEEVGSIHDLTKIVVTKVLADLAEWDNLSDQPLKVSINLSGREFNEQQINELLEPIVAANRTQQIEFELTENYLMSHAFSALELMEIIRKTGITIAIDDFGTGYSSLAYLKRFPIDKLKIDQSLVRDITSNKSDLAIVSAIVALGHALDLQVVAEGVETAEQRHNLEVRGVELLQGYLFSKPLPKSLVIEKITALNKTLKHKKRYSEGLEGADFSLL